MINSARDGVRADDSTGLKANSVVLAPVTNAPSHFELIRQQRVAKRACLSLEQREQNAREHEELSGENNNPLGGSDDLDSIEELD
ncbi:hypothetical protein C0991_006489 [Blastosporella zonata]|nr:hypothetical protein C0991_006489 [Blastosporella zonata]